MNVLLFVVVLYVCSFVLYAADNRLQRLTSKEDSVEYGVCHPAISTRKLIDDW